MNKLKNHELKERKGRSKSWKLRKRITQKRWVI